MTIRSSGAADYACQSGSFMPQSDYDARIKQPQPAQLQPSSSSSARAFSASSRRA